MSSRTITRQTNPGPRATRRSDILAYLAGRGGPSAPPAVLSLTATAGTGRVTLAWPAVAGAASYDVESAMGTLGPWALLSLSGTAGFADLSASSALPTFYRVRARNAVGAGPYSPVASATATAPSVVTTSSTSLIPVPTNLRRRPLWLPTENRGTDIWGWDAVPGATAYKLYQSDFLLGTVTGSPPPPTFQQPSAVRNGGLMAYVTAVTAQGESIASGLCAPSEPFAPGSPPSGSSPDRIPAAVLNLEAEGQWNAGQPRILIRWGGNTSGPAPFRVYREGVLLCDGLTRCEYTDSAVVAGQSYGYTVTSVNEYHAPPTESPQSSVASAMAPIGPPALSATPIPITRVVSRDDGVFVFFNAVGGAKDYLCYKHDPAKTPDVLLKNAKAAGEFRTGFSGYGPSDPPPAELCIHMNDLDPVNPTTLRLAAVDKLARFQKQDGMMAGMSMVVPGGPGMPNMNNDFVAQVNGPVPVDGFVKNGQGDPSNVPNIIALSAPFSVSCTPFALTGDDGHGGSAFLDRFRDGDNEPIVQAPLTTDIAALLNAGDAGALLDNRNFRRFHTPNWEMTLFTADNANSKLFFMPHFMSVIYDGGGPAPPFNFGVPTAAEAGLHIANTSLIMQPRENDPASPHFGELKYFDIAGGKCLHLTMEVDAHLDGRRFLLVVVKGKGQTLRNAAPLKIHDDDLSQSNRPTTDANMFAWSITPDNHLIDLFLNNGMTTGRPYDHFHLPVPVGGGDLDPMARQFGRASPRTNGSPRDLDKMHRLHLYISQTRFRIAEETPEGTYSNVIDRAFPLGQTLPWTQIEGAFVHEVYHSGNDAFNGEQYSEDSFPGGPRNRHWVNNRPHADERHWDNMGGEVLPGFPVEPLDIQLDRATIPAGATSIVGVTWLTGHFLTVPPAFGLSGGNGCSLVSTTVVDDTHVTLSIQAGMAGPVAIVSNGNDLRRSQVLQIV